LERASQPLSEEKMDIAFECWSSLRCEVPGGGDMVLGIADGFGDNTWRKFSFMEAILQALTYPEIGEIIYTNASGDLATMQTNVRSLSAQGADVILTYNDFGPSVYPAYAAAQDAGAVVAAYVSPSPEAGEESVGVTVTADACQVGKDKAELANEVYGGKAKIALFTGTPGNPQGGTWMPCVESGIEGTDMEIVFRADTNWTPAGAFEGASSLIASGESVDVIMYDYSTPFVQVTDAYLQAKASPPDYMAWTMDNGLFCQWEELQGTPNEFDVYYTHSLNWAARVALTAAIKKKAGEDVDSEIIYPMPFVKAETGVCQADKPGDFPASALVPESLVEKMLK
jgi:ABC-type sugar transport system substrate-binding protein